MRTSRWSRSRRRFPLMCVNCCCCILWKDFFFRKKWKFSLESNAAQYRNSINRIHRENCVWEREPKKNFSCMRMLLCWGNNKSKNKQKIVNFYEFFFPFLFSFFFLSLIVVVVVARHPTFWKKNVQLSVYIVWGCK